MPLQKSSNRRDRSFSTPCRLRMTGWLALKRSATSWAWLNDLGAMTDGFAFAATGRTTGFGFGGGGGASPRLVGGIVRTAVPSLAAGSTGGGGAGRLCARTGAGSRVGRVWVGGGGAG